jgi:hypothetical protein
LLPAENELTDIRAQMDARRQAHALAKHQKKSKLEKHRHAKAEAALKEIGRKKDAENTVTGQLKRKADGNEQFSKAAKAKTSEGTSSSSSSSMPTPAPVAPPPPTAGARKALTSASSLTKAAGGEVAAQSEKSSVFKNLFHTDGEADKKDRDLFMSVAGFRYTLS